jgi:uncharacterized cupin superfamily protein
MRRIRIDPGAFSTPLHVHRSDEETFYVLGGSGLSFQDDRTHEVRAGDCIVHREAAEAHTLRAGDGGLDVLVFGVTREAGSGAYLPRAGVMWARPGWLEPAGGKSPFEREAELGPPQAPEPEGRPASIVNVDEVEATREEREDCRATWQRLGRAAGARRTHLNRIVLDPGRSGAPPHCHSAAEELFVVLEGSGSLFVGDEQLELSPGHVTARPAGTGVAHSFTAGPDGLALLAYGPKEPNDICYYPRSNTLVFAGVGVVTRVERLSP